MAGIIVEQDLMREHVDTNFLVKEKSEQTATSVLLIANTGARTALVYRGASHMLTPEDIVWEQLESRWIHLSSVENIALVLKVMQFAKERNISLSWNPGNWELQQIQSGTLKPDWTTVHLLCVNREEMSMLSGQDLSKDEIWKTEWCFVGPDISIVTDGKNGGKYCDHGQCVWFEAEQVKIVQETGAGDAFITGVIAGQLKGITTEQSISLGKQEAASVIQHMGAKTGLLHA
jgi:fructokinase